MLINHGLFLSERAFVCPLPVRRACSAMLLFITVLTSLLPRATVAAPITLAPTARAIPAVPTILDEPPPGHRPAAAKSIISPDKLAEIINRAIEDTHRSRFDGTFSGPLQREMLAYPDTISLTIPNRAGHTHTMFPMTLPAYAHDSFSVEVQVFPAAIPVDGGPMDTVAWIEAKPITGTEWMNMGADLLGGGEFLPNPSPVTPVWRTFAMRPTRYHLNNQHDPSVLYENTNRLFPDVPIQLRLHCRAMHPNVDGGQCTFKNFRFYNDVTGWTRQDQHALGSGVHDVHYGQRTGIVNETVGSISPDQGPYWLLDQATGMAAYGVQYIGPVIQFPTFDPAHDTLTASFRWASEVLSPNSKRSAITVGIYHPDDNTGGPLIEVLSSNTPTSTPWQTTWSTYSLSSLSGRRGIIYVGFSDGNDQRIGLDSVKFYINNVEVPWLNSDDQGYNCKCTKTANGGYQLVVGDPVNTLSGVLIESATDVVVATAGTPLSMQRTYVSGLADPVTIPQSPLGFGWRFNYGETLTLPTASVGAEANTIIYESAEGNRYRFSGYGTTYQPAIGVRAALTVESPGYRITFPDKSWRAFNSEGRLIQLADAAGRTQTITLGTSGVATGLPTSVVDDLSGRKLTLSYRKLLDTTLIRVGTVKDDLNQVTTYGYDTAGHLTWVTSPQGTITRYETNSLHQIIGIAKGLTSYDTTASRRDLVMTYTNGKVTQQVERDGRTWQYAYETAPDGTPRTTTTIRRNGAILDTQVAHYRGDKTLQWIEHNDTFAHYQTTDANLAPASQADANGTTQYSLRNAVSLPTRLEIGSVGEFQHTASGLVTSIEYASNNQPQTILAPGNLVTTAQYNTANQPTSIQVGNLPATTVTYVAGTQLPDTVTSPDGIVTKYTYTPAGQTSTVDVGYGTSAVQKTGYSYDALGRLTHVTVGKDTLLESVTYTEYRPDNHVWKVTQNYTNGGSPVTASANVVTEYGYDSYGRRIWTKGPDGRYRAVTSYDSTGRVRWVVDNALNGSGVPTVPTLTG